MPKEGRVAKDQRDLKDPRDRKDLKDPEHARRDVFVAGSVLL